MILMFPKRKQFLKQGLAILLALALLFCFPGCSTGDDPLSLTIPLSGSVKSLDPQYASTSLEFTVLKNCMEGLMRVMPDGSLEYGEAQGVDISEDELTYSFHLSEDTYWSDGTKVSASDFYYTFYRIQQGSCSDIAKELFDNIVGIGNDAPLGVSVVSPYELSIRLIQKDANFLTKLGHVTSFPCNQNYYENTHARYGKDLDYMIFNGPYVIKSWGRSEILFRANKQYKGTWVPGIENVNCVLNCDTILESFNSGYLNCAVLSKEDLQQVTAKGTTHEIYRNQLYSLILNQDNAALSDLNLRKAMLLCIDFENYINEDRMEYIYEVADTVVPPTSKIEGLSYRDYLAQGLTISPSIYNPYGLNMPIIFSNQIQLGYDPIASSNAFSVSRYNGQDTLSILMTDDDEWIDYCGWLQQQWLDSLGIIVNLDIVDENTYLQRLENGDYTLAIFRYAAPNSVSDTLLYFSSSECPLNFQDTTYSSLIREGRASIFSQDSAVYYAAAENILNQNYIIKPIYFGNTYFFMKRGIDGILCSAGGADMFFATAKFRLL